MYAVLHARNWHSKDHKYPPIYLKGICSPKITTEDYLQQAIGDIILIMKEPLKTLPLFSYSDATTNTINHISHILHKITSQPRLQILPLPPLLTHTHSENLQLQNIPSIPVPAPMVEPVLQPPRMQALMSSPTSPTRL